MVAYTHYISSEHLNIRTMCTEIIPVYLPNFRYKILRTSWKICLSKTPGSLKLQVPG